MNISTSQRTEKSLYQDHNEYFTIDSSSVSPSEISFGAISSAPSVPLVNRHSGQGSPLFVTTEMRSVGQASLSINSGFMKSNQNSDLHNTSPLFLPSRFKPLAPLLPKASGTTQMVSSENHASRNSLGTDKYIKFDNNNLNEQIRSSNHVSSRQRRISSLEPSSLDRAAFKMTLKEVVATIIPTLHQGSQYSKSFSLMHQPLAHRRSSLILPKPSSDVPHLHEKSQVFAELHNICSEPDNLIPKIPVGSPIMPNSLYAVTPSMIETTWEPMDTSIVPSNVPLSYEHLKSGYDPLLVLHYLATAEDHSRYNFSLINSSEIANHLERRPAFDPLADATSIPSPHEFANLEVEFFNAAKRKRTPLEEFSKRQHPHPLSPVHSQPPTPKRKPVLPKTSIADVAFPPSPKSPSTPRIPYKGRFGSNPACGSCHTSKTPYWRDSWSPAFILCNACGLRYSKFKRYCKDCNYVPRKEDKGAKCCMQCQGSWNFVHSSVGSVAVC